MMFRRRRYIINTGFQIKTILIFALVSLSGSFIAATAFNFFALEKLETLIWSTHIGVKTTGEILNTLFIYVNITGFLFISILLTITAVQMTKKTAGPLYRMSKDIYKVANGDLTIDITLRQKDEFKDIAYELDAMLKNIKKRFNAINEKYANISKSIKEFNKKTVSTETEIIDCRSMLLNIEGLEKELTNFKLREK